MKVLATILCPVSAGVQGGLRTLEVPGVNDQVLNLFACRRDAQAFAVFLVMEFAILHALGASLDFYNADSFQFYGSANGLQLF
ncbi:hypothetical protein [Pseudomonas sp. SM4]|uniref:hypothetical protein n=1 Tax=Pseudomonas sp. SM4 TaxID=3424177 RepID=UPI003F7A50C6